MQFMVAISRAEEKQTFAKRLEAACDFRGVKAKGRPAFLAKQMGVSTQAAQKWLDAEAIPDQTNIGRLAKILKVNAEWLQAGPEDQVIPANNDEFMKKLAPLWAGLTDNEKDMILALAQGHISRRPALPDDNNKAKSILKPPTLSDPIGE